MCTCMCVCIHMIILFFCMIPTIFAPELVPGDAVLQLPVHPALLLPEVFSSTKDNNNN